ncbi:hypothetical protein DSM112329_03843 [Paraconexibacter sp. AEG42_29]|uniref:IPT/TIG domain-containing protein n=1 Tax=Paraconexibacter sp. AEG42_29 TaxID=2997339 RepID=A0AAU7AZ99_9ACTN
MPTATRFSIPRHTRRAAVLAGSLSAAVLVPAAGAHAATVTVSQPCQLVSFGLTATLAGFTPNTTVTLSGDGVSGSTLVDAAGSGRILFNAPSLGASGPLSRQLTVTARDSTPNPQQGFARFRVATFAFSSGGGVQSPKARRSWRFSGLQPGRPVFGHFRFGGRTRANHRFGVAKGPCGELTATAPGIPVKGRVDTGRWTIQIDQRPVYDRATKPRLTGSTSVVVVYNR